MLAWLTQVELRFGILVVDWPFGDLFGDYTMRSMFFQCTSDVTKRRGS